MRAAIRWGRAVAVFGCSVLGSVTAGAQGARPRMVDEAELYVRAWTPSPEGGYVVRVDATVYGVTSDQDAVRVDVKQNGRAVGSQRCAFNGINDGAGHLQCEVGRDALLTATGDLTIDLVYVDDVAETTVPLRAMSVRMNAYPYWVRSDGSRQIMGKKYQIDGSDQLGTAFAYMTRPWSRQTEADEPQAMEFFASFSGFFNGGNNPVLRCTAAGVRVPDRRVSFSAFAEYDADERLDQNSEIRRIGWYRARISVQDLWWGRRINIPASGTGYDTTDTAFLGDHPGLWSCDLRREGQVLRTFKFNVDAEGRVAAHTEETGANAIRLAPGLHLVDVRLPTPNPIDAAVDPAAIRRTSQYGRPWSNPAGVAEMLGALPAASGSIAPSRGAGTAAGRAAGGATGGRRRGR